MFPFELFIKIFMGIGYLLLIVINESVGGFAREIASFMGYKDQENSYNNMSAFNIT